MTPVMRFLRNAGERLFGTFAEGPEPPRRLRAIVELFARANPGATVAEWVEFAAGHAGTSYQLGYVRGCERTERLGPDWEDPDDAAEAIARMEEVAAGNLPAFDPGAVVPVEAAPADYAERAARAISDYAEEARGSGRRGPAPR
jgi:hypothetical protein